MGKQPNIESPLFFADKQFKSYDEEKQAFHNFVKKIHQKIQTDIAKKLGLQTVSPEKKVEANIREQLNNVLANVQGRIQNQRPPVGPYVRNPPVDSKYIKTNQAEPNQLPKKMVSVDTLLPRKP
uniref:Uncharacterized protein n=1 Tax=Romanomermis culicivorax TaxID=13658 RepID=A0A915IC42_ROMCU